MSPTQVRQKEAGTTMPPGNALGGGSFGAGGPADQADVADPLWEPVRAAAVMAHMRIDSMNPPRMMIKRSMLMMTMRASRDIRALRSTAVRIGKTQEWADSFADKQVLFDALLAGCPFA